MAMLSNAIQRFQPSWSVMRSDAPIAKVEDSGSERLFTFRLADTRGRRNSANALLRRMYSWRGYESTPLPLVESRNRVTLVAVDRGETVCTMTVGFDGPAGLQVDELFPLEVAALRDAGHKPCEFTKLAMDRVQSKTLFASLSHLACLYAHRLKDCDVLLIEVNPRHVRYYERMLGFEPMSPERLNRRVNAPAVLMRLNFSHLFEQVAKHGGQADASTERTLYPYFFSPDEEPELIDRLMGRRFQVRSPLRRH